MTYLPFYFISQGELDLINLELQEGGEEDLSIYYIEKVKK